MSFLSVDTPSCKQVYVHVSSLPGSHCASIGSASFFGRMTEKKEVSQLECIFAPHGQAFLGDKHRPEAVPESQRAVQGAHCGCSLDCCAVLSLFDRADSPKCDFLPVSRCRCRFSLPMRVENASPPPNTPLSDPPVRLPVARLVLRVSTVRNESERAGPVGTSAQAGYSCTPSAAG